MKLNFKHNYEKLSKCHYTTIRGKTKALKYKVGLQVEVTVKRQLLHLAIETDDSRYSAELRKLYRLLQHSARDSNPDSHESSIYNHEQREEGGGERD